MSTAYSTADYYSATLPLAVPGKEEYPAGYYNGGHDGYSVSPPEYASEHGSTSSSSGGASYSHGYSATGSSYAGSSQGDYDSSASAGNVDFHDYMQDRFAESFNPIPLDKSMAKQAQTSVSPFFLFAIPGNSPTAILRPPGGVRLREPAATASFAGLRGGRSVSTKSRTAANRRPEQVWQAQREAPRAARAAEEGASAPRQVAGPLRGGPAGRAGGARDARVDAEEGHVSLANEFRGNRALRKSSKKSREKANIWIPRQLSQVQGVQEAHQGVQEGARALPEPRLLNSSRDGAADGSLKWRPVPDRRVPPLPPLPAIPRIPPPIRTPGFFLACRFPICSGVETGGIPQGCILRFWGVAFVLPTPPTIMYHATGRPPRFRLFLAAGAAAAWEGGRRNEKRAGRRRAGEEVTLKAGSRAPA